MIKLKDLLKEDVIKDMMKQIGKNTLRYIGARNFAKGKQRGMQYIQFDVNWGDFYKHMNAESTSEDGNICVHNRHIYEALGCKIAPIEVAARFAHEKPLPETKGITPFGFHYHLPEGTVL